MKLRVRNTIIHSLPWTTIFGSLVMRFAIAFHSCLRHSWKLLANRLTRHPPTGKRYSNLKETSCLPLLNARFEPKVSDTKLQASYIYKYIYIYIIVNFDALVQASDIRILKSHSTIKLYLRLPYFSVSNNAFCNIFYCFYFIDIVLTLSVRTHCSSVICYINSCDKPRLCHVSASKVHLSNYSLFCKYISRQHTFIFTIPRTHV